MSSAAWRTAPLAHLQCVARVDVDPWGRAEGDFDGAAGDDHEAGGLAAVDEASDPAPAQEASPLAAADSAMPTLPAHSLDDGALCELIQRIVERDQRALEALYDATSARVHGLVLRITQQAALAEEVVEETYWQVWRQAPRFDATRGRPATWLLAMARSRAIDAIRRDRRFAHEALPDDDAADAIGAALPPQDLLDATRSHAELHAAVAGLDARARQVVALAFFRGLTHEEIADQERMPLGTVKSLIRRSLQELRRHLEAGSETPREA